MHTVSGWGIAAGNVCEAKYWMESLLFYRADAKRWMHLLVKMGGGDHHRQGHPSTVREIDLQYYLDTVCA